MTPSSHPAVSVVMSVHNGEPFVAETVESILGQTFHDFEFIILNNASTDGTGEVLSRYRDPRIVHVVNDTCLSMPQSFNKGNRLARGRYIAHTDADDLSMPDRLERQSRFLDGNPEVALVASQIVLIDGQSRKIGGAWTPTGHDDLVRAFAHSNPIAHSSFMFRRDVIAALGDYPEDFTYAEDFALLLEIAARHRLAALPDALVSIRQHPAQASSVQAYRKVRSHDAVRLFRRAGMLPGLSRDDLRRNRRTIAQALLRHARVLWSEGERGPAAAAFLEGVLQWASGGIPRGLRF